MDNPAGRTNLTFIKIQGTARRAALSLLLQKCSSRHIANLQMPCYTIITLFRYIDSRRCCAGLYRSRSYGTPNQMAHTLCAFFLSWAFAAFFYGQRSCVLGSQRRHCPEPTLPPAAALAVLTAAMLILPRCWHSCPRRRMPVPFTIRCISSPHRILLRLCAALIALWGFALLYFDQSDGSFRLLAVAFCLLTASCLLLLSSSPSHAALALAEITCCSTGWLAVLFSRHASDPVLPDFWPPLLALCATSLSACFLTSAACGWPKLRRTMFALLAGGTLCLIAFGRLLRSDFFALFFAYLAAALWQLHGAFCLSFRPPRKRRIAPSEILSLCGPPLGAPLFPYRDSAHPG